MRGASEARWWNPECINTYKVSTIVITDYILNYIKDGRALDILSEGCGFLKRELDKRNHVIDSLIEVVK